MLRPKFLLSRSKTDKTIDAMLKTISSFFQPTKAFLLQLVYFKKVSKMIPSLTTI